ncbi:hypothetical protein Hanom_Chr09g00803131 [Helianthus anomalus]
MEDLFCDVLGNSSGAGKSDLEAGGLKTVVRSSSNVLIVPDRTLAFNEFFGVAVVGRTVDLETLVDLDKLLRYAKVPYSRIQYLGGLSILISFGDDPSSNKFLSARDVWGPWFSKLEAWKGQSLSLERVAWLNVHGISLHLLEEGIVKQIGELFGKVLHIPNGLVEELDLSMVRVGVLAGEAQRINEVVTLSWRNRNFKVWVEEEKDAWQPDCLGYSCEPRFSSDSGSPLMSSPVGFMPEDDLMVNNEHDQVGGKEGEEKSSRADEGVLHGDLGSMHVEREKSGEGMLNDPEYFGNGGIPRPVGGTPNVFLSHEGDVLSGGPIFGDSAENLNFILGSGEKGSKAHRKATSGPFRRKGRPVSHLASPPVDQRPRKRSRNEEKDLEHGFGFVGFTSRSQEGIGVGNLPANSVNGDIDLNVRAVSVDLCHREPSASGCL